ncbi:hypothetical protein VTL71DRAFT_3250 [Oculimacula yallundae]|uniref:2EXR domain-containing protein n=1 Tax=Oculimacula yallundae TaxID=86028 RepID=A0ABR4C6L5_9HELO
MMEENPGQDIVNTRHNDTKAFDPAQAIIVHPKVHDDHGILNQISLPTYFAPSSVFHNFPKLPTELQDMIWKTALSKARCIVPQFNCLPVCIRDQEALDLYHGVSVTVVVQNARSQRGSLLTQRGKVVEKSGPGPTLLWTCHNSRRIALLAYDRCFSWEIDPGALFKVGCRDDGGERWRSSEALSERTLQRNFGSNGILFQPQVDTIYLRDSDIASYLAQPPLRDLPFRNIKKLAIRSTEWWETAWMVQTCLGDTSYERFAAEAALTRKPWFQDLEELTIVDARCPEGRKSREAELNF